MFFCVSKTSDVPGHDHLVHKEGCPNWPAEDNRIDLGHHQFAFHVMTDVWKIYPDAVGCPECSPEITY